MEVVDNQLRYGRSTHVRHEKLNWCAPLPGNLYTVTPLFCSPVTAPDLLRGLSQKRVNRSFLNQKRHYFPSMDK